MGFFAGQTKTFQLDDENTVTLRKLSYGDRQEAMSRTSVLTSGAANPQNGASGGEAESEVSVDVAMLELEILQRIIVRWDGPGWEGRKPSRSAIRDLDVAVASRIMELYNGWAGESEEDLAALEKK